MKKLFSIASDDAIQFTLKQEDEYVVLFAEKAGEEPLRLADIGPSQPYLVPYGVVNTWAEDYFEADDEGCLATCDTKISEDEDE